MVSDVYLHPYSAAARYSQYKSNVFYTHFDVEDVANALTIANWIPLEFLPKLPVQSLSHGFGDTGVVEQGGSGTGDQTKAAPEGGDNNNNNNNNNNKSRDNKKLSGLPGLPTPAW